MCHANLDTLEQLVEHNLVRRWSSGRLGMLETIRELAVEKLEASGEAADIERRHAEFFLELAESSGLRLDTLGKLPQRHDLVLPELHNLRAAMDWAVANDPELGLRIAVGIENIWVTHDPREGRRRFERLLERAGDVDPYLRARALLDLGGCSEWSGDTKSARAAYEEAEALFAQLADASGVAEARFRLGVVAHREGNHERARELWQESLDEWQRLDHEIGQIQALGNLGRWEFEYGDDLDRAAEMMQRSLEMARRVGWTWWEVGVMGDFAELSLVRGDVEEGQRRAREYLARAREIEDRTNTLFAFGILAWAAAERGDAERATTLWAAAEAEEASAPESNWAASKGKYAAHIPDEPRPAAPLELEEAVEYALADA